jgi:3'(2'), 5'-bisphosphate nucleotidase
MEINRSLLDQIIELSKSAGDAILEIYNRDADFNTEIKTDDSPVTDADKAAHHVLFDALATIDPDIPVLSEEGNLPDFETRSSWHRYWIIDPLDGTKEFIKRNGEFTVNVALIENGVPILGVVHVPVLKVTYAGATHLGALKIDTDGERSIEASKAPVKNEGVVRIVASRSHGSEAVEKCVAKLEKYFGSAERKSMGSSLKLCLVAEGEADIYPRLALTSEWDTAAAQAVVEAAGGVVLDADLKELRYNTKADILNPYFYVLGDTSFNWAKLLA